MAVPAIYHKSTERHPMIGKALSHYEVLAKIGQGGMGEVYRALDTKLDREVALKVLPTDMAGDPERIERFEREAKAVAALKHPNIVTIHSVEEIDGVLGRRAHPQPDRQWDTAAALWRYSTGSESPSPP
jgi:hypothetical protein